MDYACFKDRENRISKSITKKNELEGVVTTSRAHQEDESFIGDAILHHYWEHYFIWKKELSCIEEEKTRIGNDHSDGCTFEPSDTTVLDIDHR